MVSASHRTARGAGRKRGDAARPRLEGLPGGGEPGGDPGEPDGLLHHRMRLGIVSALAGTDALTFVELRELLETTDGNLSVHARRLEDAGYIACAKSFAERRPRTEYRLAPAGRRALERYLAHMEALIAVARHSLQR